MGVCVWDGWGIRNIFNIFRKITGEIRNAGAVAVTTSRNAPTCRSRYSFKPIKESVCL